MPIEIIGLETTNRCNYACIHCLRADIAPRKQLPLELQDAIGPRNARRDFPPELIDKIIAEARPLEIPKVSFTGGEPTIHPQFDVIIKKFCEAGYRFGMVTNGTNFADTYRKIAPYRDQLFGVCFSMDGATPATMDAIRQKNAFATTMQAISVCGAKGLPFSIQMVVTQSNRHELEAMVKLATRMGAPKVFFSPLQPTLQTTHANLNVPPQAWYEIKDEILELTKMYNVEIEPNIGFPAPENPWTRCNALSMRALYLDYLGNMTFCCQLSDYADSQVRTDVIGNVADMHLLDACSSYMKRINDYQKEKARLIDNNELTELDAFPCWYCAKHFKKVDFMKRFPDDPWYETSAFGAGSQMESACSDRDDVNGNTNGRARLLQVQAAVKG